MPDIDISKVVKKDTEVQQAPIEPVEPVTSTKIFKFECKDHSTLSVCYTEGENTKFIRFENGAFETTDEKLAEIVRSATSVKIVELA